MFGVGVVSTLIVRILSFSEVAFADTVVISLPDTTVAPGTVVRIPVRTSMMPLADSVIGFNFGVKFPADVFEPSSLKAERGPLLPVGSNFQSRFASDTIRVVWSYQLPMVGSGILFYVVGTVRSKVEVPENTIRDLEIVKINGGLALLNEGRPPSIGQNGVLRVKSPVSVRESRPDRMQPRIAAWPNPFNPVVNLRLEGAEELLRGSPVEGTIVNPLGQVVRTWTMPAGGVWTWDGLDDAGRPASSGVYLVVIGRGDVWYRRAVTLLR